MMEKDSAFKENSVKIVKDHAQNAHRTPFTKTTHRRNLPPTTPAEDGAEGYKCVLCQGKFGDRHVLETQYFWVTCHNCKSKMHYTCAKAVKECVCKQMMRLQRLK